MSRPMRVRLRWWWWSLQNWSRGYAWGPIQRCRRCHHTAPYHYAECPFTSPVPPVETGPDEEKNQ